MSPVRPLGRRGGESFTVPRGARVIVGDPARGSGLRIAVVVARFNDRITNRLLLGAFGVLEAAGVRAKDLAVVFVPGAFELPFAARRLAASRRYDAVICLGAVVRGGTPHFDFVAGEAARGIASASEETGVPVLFGVLTTDSARQALDRSGGRLGNRGADAARAGIEMAQVARGLRARRSA
ncbi:MAG: 6,7-dimethyl-8-ribityllumazine synthase [Candidatus Eisenbacteria bacterium]